jgi:DNA-damage-inducible protein J
MTETTTIQIITTSNIEVDSDLLAQAQEVLAEQGLTLPEAIELFFRHCVEHGFPFSEEEIRLCQEETKRQAAEASEEGPNPQCISGFKELLHVDSSLLGMQAFKYYNLAKKERAICIDEEGKPAFVLLSADFYQDVIFPSLLLEDWDF